MKSYGLLLICSLTMSITIKAKIDDTVITVEWENNEAVKALSKIASESAVTINMSQYGGFEQVGPLGQSLPRNDSQTTTAPGDIVLYSGNQIVVFYGSNTWSYTRLGKITDKTEAELKTILNKEKVTLTLSANSDEPTTEPEQPEKKSLVAYFSVTHNTKTIAEYISEYTGSTLYEIVPKQPYTSEDINYSDNSSRTSIEQNDPNARPEIASTIDDIDQYDVIYLGYPIWWGQAPKIMYSFLESVTIKEDAVIVPFCTSGSSPIGMSATNLKQSANAANWLEGRRFAASTDKTTVTQWIDSLNLK
ncbi:MAG: NAD(P)H-dependent oxidoreductase [Proteobacteria bacterium]|nr:NAD(P)H-dependent oxidoreductase [Pseudomonadota bacterium]